MGLVFNCFFFSVFTHHLGQNLVLDGLQSARLGQRLRFEGDTESLVDLNRQLDGHDGGEADIAQHRRHTEVLGVDNLCNDAMDFLLQHIHRHLSKL